MTDRKTASTIDDDALDALYAERDRLTAELADLRQVARGYCPACGRGDAAPTVDDWEQQKQRAERAEAAITRVQEITPYCDIPVASGMLRVVRLDDINRALAALDQPTTSD